jgi:cyclic pyranopterin phosphate synthase
MKKFSHIDRRGKAVMVDVSAKVPQLRVARAAGRIRLQPRTVALLRRNQLRKGDALAVAEVAGIQAAKRAAELIPLCHPLQTTHIAVKAVMRKDGVEATSEVRCSGPTGTEMEALTAVSVALLTLYDMCKAVDKTMQITEVRLVEKSKTDIAN